MLPPFDRGTGIEPSNFPCTVVLNKMSAISSYNRPVRKKHEKLLSSQSTGMRPTWVEPPVLARPVHPGKVIQRQKLFWVLPAAPMTWQLSERSFWRRKCQSKLRWSSSIIVPVTTEVLPRSLADRWQQNWRSTTTRWAVKSTLLVHVPRPQVSSANKTNYKGQGNANPCKNYCWSASA